MKRVFTLMLALIMVLGICGCGSDVDDVLSQEIVHEQIYVDENGNEVSLDSITTSSNDEETNSQPTSSPPSSNTSSNVSNSEKPIKIDYDTTVEVDICDDVIRGYLDASTPARQFEWLNQYSGSKLDNQCVSLDWYLDASYIYTVTFSENADFSNAHTIQTKFTDITNALLIPGKTYYWKVTGTWSDEVLGGGKIYVKNTPVRWIKVDGVGNVRDIGGWKAENGKTVKYGMIYRGRELKNATEDGLQTIKSLGWKTELDLRYKDQKFQKEGTGMNYVFIETNTQYHALLLNDQEKVKANYKMMFELLSDKNNYPFYTHCSAGADRTGTFVFIANGLLGVSYEDLTRDFELTSFSPSGKRWRSDGPSDIDGEMTVEGNTVAWGKLYDEMMKHGQANGCTTLQQSIEHWLTSYVGVPKEQIDSFKNIMLQ